ncbi:glycosyltransferase family 2 protein [uncultured Piscinibacter sp.]|uniref:glycosyltransferase family 2 protein n=1 Tax=uncultured Piscinibacter sp. TaxID=1131835 RepID=UPI002603B8DD|nr:glycosyltransferase family 2 protein [uncultured Piscinibacter sp.]
MDRQPPLVTVGIPIYNGAKHLEKTAESLLAQTLGDFELLIADNASTDRTPEICAALAHRDPRVRIIRHATNIGAPRNWNCLVHEARGRYFKWASANDRCSPLLLERCVQALEADPGAVLSYGHTQLTDENDQPIEVYAGDIDVRMERPSERFAIVCQRMNLNNAMCGVVRTDVLRKTGLDRLYPSGDMALTSELALHGRILLLPDVLLYRRHAPGSFTSLLDPLQIQRMYDPGAQRPMKLIRSRRHLDNMACIARAPIDWTEKFRAAGTALRLMAWDRRRLWNELRALAGLQTTG